MKKILCVLLALCLFGCSKQEVKEEIKEEVIEEKEETVVEIEEEIEFVVTSDSINSQGRLLTVCAYSNGNNEHPSVSYPSVKDAAIYKVFMIDVSANNWVHWIASTSSTNITQNESMDTSMYKGPYPPTPDHEYQIHVYALSEDIDVEIPFDTGCDFNSIENQMSDVILEHDFVTCLYSPNDNNE